MPGLARTLSKLGFCSRKAATDLVRAGKVTVNGSCRRDPEFAVVLERDRIAVEGAPLQAVAFVYLMLNKPRRLVTTVADAHGRDTVYTCLQDPTLPAHLSAVGRLDKASEGLLLFTNDTAWANALTDPASHIDKTYHVQVNRLVDDELMGKLRGGVEIEGERHRLKTVRLLRSGEKQCWLEIRLDEGKNRHIRRVLEAFELEVKRLVRVAIGDLVLAELAKGSWRRLNRGEVERLGR